MRKINELLHENTKAKSDPDDIDPDDTLTPRTLMNSKQKYFLRVGYIIVISVLLWLLLMPDSDYRHRMTRTYLLDISIFLRDYYLINKKFPSLSEFKTALDRSEFIEFIHKNRQTYYYSPAGFVDQQGKLWNFVLFDMIDHKCLKLEIDIEQKWTGNTVWFEEKADRIPDWLMKSKDCKNITVIP